MVEITTYPTKEKAVEAGAVEPVIDEDTKRWYFSNTQWKNAHGGWHGDVVIDGKTYPNGLPC